MVQKRTDNPLRAAYTEKGRPVVNLPGSFGNNYKHTARMNLLKSTISQGKKRKLEEGDEN
ncbi:hypothetical protein NQ317_019781 [Molorchus minor]|uniref:Uncharacterized protein n=1 Tax=Molorchus minor TaxID=1323400 RepID=A0ABQ9K3A0_9CUCU|nr:hypothetical protein NQ317_019781 [Molorchus minor]